MTFELDWLKRWALYSPQRTALRDKKADFDVSFQELYQISNSGALELQKRGVKAGDRIAVLAKNSWQYMSLLFCAQRIGAILVPINHRLTKSEIAYIIGDASPTLIIAEDEFADRLDRFTSWSDFFANVSIKGGRELEMKADPETPCLILYTSGTTGRPKGAIINHRMLFWNAVNTQLRLDISSNDIQLAFAPLFHTGGWNVLLTPFLHRGCKSVLLEKFDADELLKTVETEKISILFGVPTMLDMMSKSPLFGAADLTSLRFVIVGGEPMPIELIRVWENKGIPIRQGYGLTEFGPNVFSLSEADSIRKIGSIGFPNFYVEVRVVNREGKDVPPGEIGELWLKGPMATPGYWNHAQATEQLFVGEWLKTGDLVRRDEEGYFFVAGRKKDMFISGGENVYPAEIEQTLRSHQDILEAAVIGVPDPKWGECGQAFVVAKRSIPSDELLEYCRNHLARFKVPKSFVFVDALPKSDSGKILKRELRPHSQ